MNTSPVGLIGRLIDAALELDPETRHALAELSGSVIDLDVTGVGGLRLYLDGERVRVEPREELVDAHVTIRGTPLSLARFAFVDDREKLILSGEVSLHGDIALATRLQRIVARMDLDFEEALAQRMGDIPAHQISRRLRGLGGWMHAAGTALLADVSEYLRHEAAATPAVEDMERFSNAVDAVRDDVERLEARVARLGRRPVHRP
ncbi:MAG: SCP2 sterol-binding domain-containing protein [Thiotrichales bacterium]|nr:SCP2 sterol-binding domain-containing protein [Thiotrichales bacterium]